MASAPLNEMTDAAVLERWLSRWDHQLLKTHGVPTAAYEKAKTTYLGLNKRNKPETVAETKATFVVEKRQLIAKLEELRAAAGQTMRSDPSIAGTAVAASSAAAEKIQLAMVQEQIGRAHV